MDLKNIDTPALIIDLEIVERNLFRVADFAKTHRINWRPHIKTHKIQELARLQLARGASGITVASLGEAEVMAAAGIQDIFMAYQIIGAKKMERLVALVKQPIRFASAIDSLVGASMLNQVMVQNNLVHDVLLEIDTGLGRCGLTDPSSAFALARAVQQMPGLRLQGVFTHEGQTYLPDDRQKIRAIAHQAARDLVALATFLRKSGVPCVTVSVGSTPAWNVTGTIAGITEMRPGTFIFNDRIQIKCGSATLADCAATILTTIISRPAPDRAVIDAGSKSLSEAKPNFLEGFGQVKNRPNLLVNWINEEHGIILGDVTDLKIGEQIQVIPNHICTAVNLHDWALTTSGNEIIGAWQIAARGKVR